MILKLYWQYTDIAQLTPNILDIRYFYNEHTTWIHLDPNLNYLIYRALLTIYWYCSAQYYTSGSFQEWNAYFVRYFVEKYHTSSVYYFKYGGYYVWKYHKPDSFQTICTCFVQIQMLQFVWFFWLSTIHSLIQLNI